MINRLSKPSFGEAEAEALKKVLATGWVGPNGPEVKALEEDLAAYLGEGVQVLATSSGTAALHLALKVLGLGAGDLVAQPTYAYCAPAFATRYVGAEPLFIEADSETWNMKVEYLAEAFETHAAREDLGAIKAILPVHIFGNPSNMDAIQSLASQYGVPIIEDAAEAIGSKYSGRSLGTFGQMAVLSFNANKTLSAGAGGALISSNHRNIEQARFLANQAKLPGKTYLHGAIGFNYAMNDLTAAIARVQLRKIEELIQSRVALQTIYRESLSHQGAFQEVDRKGQSNFWLSAFKKEGLNDFLERASCSDIEFKKGFSPLHQMEVFQNNDYYGAGESLELEKQVLSLPSGAEVKPEEVIKYLESI